MRGGVGGRYETVKVFTHLLIESWLFIGRFATSNNPQFYYNIRSTLTVTLKPRRRLRKDSSRDRIRRCNGSIIMTGKSRFRRPAGRAEYRFSCNAGSGRLGGASTPCRMGRENRIINTRVRKALYNPTPQCWSRSSSMGFLSNNK